ncbi:MAG TPA: DUF2281 domain-containing protein [Chloroflexia bacterium]
MLTLRDQITEKLKEVPEYRLREVLDFLEFLTWKQNNYEQGNPASKEDPLLAVLGTLEGEPLTNEQIDVALYGPSFAKEEAS